MESEKWRRLFEVGMEVIGAGDANINVSQSWCSWTTCARLGRDAGCWTSGLPRREDIGDTHICDGSVCGQPFLYSDIAHIIVPAIFTDKFGREMSQNIHKLAKSLLKWNIDCSISMSAIDAKCF